MLTSQVVYGDYNSAVAEYDEEVGLSYFNNENYTMALPMLQRAAKRGSLPALDALGQMYQFGLGVDKNKTIMFNMYTKAVERQYLPSINHLAWYYYRNSQASKAFEMWKKGADLGDADFKARVGQCYEFGIGVKVDFEAAEHWFRQSALLNKYYNQYVAHILNKKGDDEAALKAYWKYYVEETDNETQMDADMDDGAVLELVTLLCSDSSYLARNPLKEVTEPDSLDGAMIKIINQFNHEKAAEIWALKFGRKETLSTELRSFHKETIKVADALPADSVLKLRMDEFNYTPERLNTGFGNFPKPTRLTRFPLFQGGEQGLYEFFMRNMRYPEGVIPGRVVVGCVIGAEGSIGNPAIEKGASPELNREALRLVKKMPKFRPAQLGPNENCYFPIAIDFASYKELFESRRASAGADDKVYKDVDQMASFPGGNVAMSKWISRHLYYPSVAEENNIQGKVIVQITIGSDGSVIKAITINRQDPFLEKEAIRVVKKMPKWIPARRNGYPVASTFNIPINFRL